MRPPTGWPGQLVDGAVELPLVQADRRDQFLDQVLLAGYYGSQIRVVDKGRRRFLRGFLVISRQSRSRSGEGLLLHAICRAAGSTASCAVPERVPTGLYCWPRPWQSRRAERRPDRDVPGCCTTGWSQ
jgi:hypothetical protein